MVKCDFLGNWHLARMLENKYRMHERAKNRSSSELGVNVGLDPVPELAPKVPSDPIKMARRAPKMHNKMQKLRKVAKVCMLCKNQAKP